MICAGVGIAANIQVYAKILIHLKPCALLRIFRTAIQISLLQLLSQGTDAMVCHVSVAHSVRVAFATAQADIVINRNKMKPQAIAVQSCHNTFVISSSFQLTNSQRVADVMVSHANVMTNA
ncbi:hypothetical protein FGO68_gene16929 [Halteria grandinella]|uniref:Uncharacterized protein n=1 Tax=Halteria grandinella TaxID=5974 RepID=A0A8J8P0R9_HALGN|nr:hypothetical protein FGO68_gene16929 [Halteria grandinella]